MEQSDKTKTVAEAFARLDVAMEKYCNAHGTTSAEMLNIIAQHKQSEVKESLPQ
jgi:hypothetical protein